MTTLLSPNETVTSESQPSAARKPQTVLPQRSGPPASIGARRPIGKISLNDVLRAVGALFSAACLTLLLFGRITHMSGKVGSVIVCFLLYIAIFAFLTSLTDRGPAILDKVMSALMTAAAMVAIIALTWVVLSTIWKGKAALPKRNLYVDDMRAAGPGDSLDVGGINHAIVGTLVIISLALLFTVPLGLACAVFLNETKSKLVEPVRSVVTAMTALPSIIAGLFIFATWILILGYPRSGLAASIAVSLMMLPIIIRSADVVLRLVPGSLREAAAALGAPQWRIIWFVVLPTARSGLSTSVILGVARGIGETAPVLLTSGSTATRNLNPLENPMMSLPLATYEFIRSPDAAMQARGFATATVLMLLVIILFTLARILGGRPAGHLSRAQSRRAAARSRRDMARIESRTREAAA